MAFDIPAATLAVHFLEVETAGLAGKRAADRADSFNLSVPKLRIALADDMTTDQEPALISGKFVLLLAHGICHAHEVAARGSCPEYLGPHSHLLWSG